MGRILIIGGGAIGLSVAYHLSKREAGEIILLERNTLTSGTTWHAAGIVGPLRATPNMTRLASYALSLFPALEDETGIHTGYRQTGGYWLARVPERMDELRRIADLGRTQGLNPRIIDPAGLDVPLVSGAGIVGAMHVPEDAHVDPVGLSMAYARACRNAGVDIRENTPVAGIECEGSRVRGVGLADGSRIGADHVILCAGAWSRGLAAGAGLDLPLQAVEHMYVVTTPVAGVTQDFPVLRDLDRGIYVKGDAGRLIIGGFEKDAKCWDAYGPEGDRAFLELGEDWAQFTPFMEAALELIPALEAAGIHHFMNGPESFTADTRPLVGAAPTVDGLFVAAGMNSVGVMSSAGIGWALAGWVLDGQPDQDMWEVDIARADPREARPAHLKQRMSEAVADQFALHWPYKQPGAGRDLRRSVLHERWAAAGAVFGVTAGWERGLWYADQPGAHALPYSTGDQHWYPIAEREAARMSDGAVMLDLSPFSKFRISGERSLAALDRLTTASLDVADGRVVYTQMLNPQGGIEADVTVTRLSRDEFLVTSGAATRQRDLAHLRRNLPDGVGLTDMTDDFAVIGLMGAGSRDLVRRVWPEFPEIAFGHSADTRLGGHRCRVTRLSFVGEYGWEIMVINEHADAVFDALYSAGARPMGHYALDGCRLEKAYRHWGHDIGPMMTPIEAGLAFTIDWQKDFTGKAALQKQRADGCRQRLILFAVEGPALMLHDEPIYHDGRHVGFTTSGGRGPRTGLTLAFGLVETEGEALSAVLDRRYEICVAGQFHDARPLRQAPYDPQGDGMRL